MRNLFTIFKRELVSYFLSPMAYVIMSIFLFATGFTFYLFLFDRSEATMRYFFETVSFFCLIMCPLISMRLVSEELKTGTIESLLTAPVTDFEVILGKYLGAMGFFVFLLLPTLLYVVMLRWLGNPDLGVVTSGYMGVLLLSGTFLAAGVFFSTMTQNQIVAASMGFVFNFCFWLIGFLGSAMPSKIRPLLEYLGYPDHYVPFLKGIVDTRHVVYFLSFIVYFLFLSTRMLETRKWR